MVTIMGTHGHYNHPSSGELYIEETDQHLLEKLELLNDFKVFIIQKKTEIDCFNSNVTHEILDHRRNVILKATNGSRSLFSRRKRNYLVVRNRRNAKLFRIVVEPTNNVSTGAEATVYIHPKLRVAHIEKYGGLLSPASFEIFNVDGKTAFTSDPSSKKATSSSVVEYDVSIKSGTVANILMKTGLNFILSTNPTMKSLDKATLLAKVLAMDILQTSSDTKLESGSSRNQYA